MLKKFHNATVAVACAVTVYAGMSWLLWSMDLTHFAVR